MEVPGHSANGRTVGASRMLTSAQCRPRRRRQGARLAPTEKYHFATLLPLVVLLAAGAPALAADSIEELLHQDEAESHNDALRRDLKALTEEQWQYYFKVERKRPDIELDGQLMVHESEERPRVLYIWVAAIAAGFGIAIGAIQASHYLSCRRLCGTIVAASDTSQNTSVRTGGYSVEPDILGSPQALPLVVVLDAADVLDNSFADTRDT
jgi:hypothetical protein